MKQFTYTVTYQDLKKVTLKAFNPKQAWEWAQKIRQDVPVTAITARPGYATNRDVNAAMKAA